MNKNKFYITRKKKAKEDPRYEDTSQPWDRLPIESDEAWSAFKVYRQLGFSRDYEKVAIRLYGAQASAQLYHIEAFAEKYDWEERARRYDLFTQEYHEEIKDRAKRDLEMRYIEAAPDVAEMQIDIALGNQKGDRVQGAMISSIIDRVAPKPQTKPHDVNIWNQMTIKPPELPDEIKKGLLNPADEVNAEDVDAEMESLIPDSLKNKRRKA